MSWSEHVAAWSQPPVDDVGYISSADMRRWNDDKLRVTIEKMRDTRYRGPRNYRNLWRDVMGLDTLTDKDVIDFGCGVGLEALELSRGGNRVALADISNDNTWLAARVLTLYDQLPTDVLLINDQPPFVDGAPGSYDVFYCNGVLHHCRWPRAIMERAHELLRDDGEVRLMVYSDVGWRIATGSEPPTIASEHPQFSRFVRYFDSVGSYADWYNYDKLDAQFGDLFTIERFEYMLPDDSYLGAVLRRR